MPFAMLVPSLVVYIRNRRQRAFMRYAKEVLAKKHTESIEPWYVSPGSSPKRILPYEGFNVNTQKSWKDNLPQNGLEWLLLLFLGGMVLLAIGSIFGGFFHHHYFYR